MHRDGGSAEDRINPRYLRDLQQSVFRYDSDVASVTYRGTRLDGVVPIGEHERYGGMAQSSNIFVYEVSDGESADAFWNRCKSFTKNDVKVIVVDVTSRSVYKDVVQGSSKVVFYEKWAKRTNFTDGTIPVVVFCTDKRAKISEELQDKFRNVDRILSSSTDVRSIEVELAKSNPSFFAGVMSVRYGELSKKQKAVLGIIYATTLLFVIPLAVIFWIYRSAQIQVRDDYNLMNRPVDVDIVLGDADGIRGHLLDSDGAYKENARKKLLEEAVKAGYLKLVKKEKDSTDEDGIKEEDRETYSAEDKGKETTALYALQYVGEFHVLSRHNKINVIVGTVALCAVLASIVMFSAGRIADHSLTVQISVLIGMLGCIVFLGNAASATKSKVPKVILTIATVFLAMVLLIGSFAVINYLGNGDNVGGYIAIGVISLATTAMLVLNIVMRIFSLQEGKIRDSMKDELDGMSKHAIKTLLKKSKTLESEVEQQVTGVGYISRHAKLDLQDAKDAGRVDDKAVMGQKLRVISEESEVNPGNELPPLNNKPPKNTDIDVDNSEDNKDKKHMTEKRESNKSSSAEEFVERDSKLEDESKSTLTVGDMRSFVTQISDHSVPEH